MKSLFSVLKYVKGYWGYAAVNIVLNVCFALFSVVSLAMVIPFLNLIFSKDNSMYEKVVAAGKPALEWTTDSLKAMMDFYLSDMIVKQGKMEVLCSVCMLVFILTILKNTCRYFALYFLAPIRNGVVKDLRNKMFDKVLELPLSYFGDERKGDIMSRITSDVQEIEWSIMQTLEMIFREPLIILISLGVLISISPMLTLYVFLCLPVAALIVSLMSKTLRRSSIQSKTLLGQLFNTMEETLGGLKVLKAFSAERAVRAKFRQVNEDYFNLSVKVYRKVDLASPFSETIVTGVLLFILFLGGNMVLNEGSLSGGVLIGFFGIASQIVPPIKQISQAYNNIQKGLASEERISAILDAQNTILEKKNAITSATFQKEIRFDNVWFSYTKGDEGYVLKGINFTIPKGKTIALVGQSGSGKTTMADMIPRFYDADKGAVWIDTVNVKDFSFHALRSLMGIVSQESILFNDTIFNNIALGMEGVSEQAVMEAAKIANAHEFIVQMTEGYNSNVGDRGSKLSGGQRQRISIARAILKNPPLLILDEATSALDTESERMVQEALGRLMQNRTSVIIAHRLSTIVNADEIIVLHKGEIMERGTHASLMEQNGTYKRLVDMQRFS